LPARTQHCISLTRNTFEIAIGKVFVKENFDQESKKKAIEMTNNILIEFKKILKEVSWMDAKSRQAALEKADAIRTQIAYPDIIFNSTYLEKLYNVRNNIMFKKITTYRFSPR
jgi:membrane metallo-endopeptidase-like protein 1